MSDRVGGGSTETPLDVRRRSGSSQGVRTRHSFISIRSDLERSNDFTSCSLTGQAMWIRLLAKADKWGTLQWRPEMDAGPIAACGPHSVAEERLIAAVSELTMHASDRQWGTKDRLPSEYWLKYDPAARRWTLPDCRQDSPGDVVATRAEQTPVVLYVDESTRQHYIMLTGYLQWNVLNHHGEKQLPGPLDPSCRLIAGQLWEGAPLIPFTVRRAQEAAQKEKSERKKKSDRADKERVRRAKKRADEEGNASGGNVVAFEKPAG